MKGMTPTTAAEMLEAVQLAIEDTWSTIQVKGRTFVDPDSGVDLGITVEAGGRRFAILVTELI